MNDVDITKIYLSPSESKKLRWIAKNEPIDFALCREDGPISRLFDRQLIEPTFSDRFPLISTPGILGSPFSALQVSDAGWQYLNLISKQARENFITRILAIAALIISAIALLGQLGILGLPQY